MKSVGNCEDEKTETSQNVQLRDHRLGVFWRYCQTTVMRWICARGGGVEGGCVVPLRAGRYLNVHRMVSRERLREDAHTKTGMAGHDVLRKRTPLLRKDKQKAESGGSSAPGTGRTK